MKPFNLVEAQMGVPVQTKSGIRIMEFFTSKHSTPQNVICVSEYGSVLLYSEEGFFGFDDDTREKYKDMDLILVEPEET